MGEEWRPALGCENYYEVSSLGRVRSVRTNFGSRRERLLKVATTHDGYLRASLCVDGRRFHRPVHQMVLEAFVGPRPAPKMQACHNDGDKQNNAVGNLRWDLPVGNYVDRTAHGGDAVGERHHGCSTTEAVARAIKAEAADRSIEARVIAKKYGTTVNVVRNIRNGSSWKWL